MPKYQIDFRLFQKFGLSLNEKKKYFIVYDPQTWTLNAVYDNLEDACKWYNMTTKEWERICEENAASTCPYTNIYNKDYVGHNYIFYKGFCQNMTVWDLLYQLQNHILDPDLGFEDKTEAMDYTLSRIDSKLQCYPDSVETYYAKIGD